MTSRRDGDGLPPTERLSQDGALGTTLDISEAHVTLIEGSRAGFEIPCGSKAVRIGSAPDNDLVITDPAVSRHHALLEPAGGRFLLKDLGSTNGTFLADVEVREAIVKPDCLIRVGNSTLRLHVKPRRVFVPPSASERFGHVAGRSVAMRQVFGLLEWVAPTETTILVTGPSGSGKELVARSIHEASPRREGRFVVLDCGALDRDLISSELFGHEEGAFTGASARRIGVLEQAQGGTLFIDEIGELSLNLQPKLLRVLEAREIRRLGGGTPIGLNVRVVAATNRDLAASVTRKEFREDLYYRLCQVRVALPSLDERREDIPLLVEILLRRLGNQTRVRGLAGDVMAFLKGRRYPGNVRELRNIVERAALIARGPRIEMSDLLLFGEESGPGLRVPDRDGVGSPNEAEPPASSRAPGAGSVPARRAAAGPTDPRSLAEVEKEAILATLAACGGNLIRTAQALGITRNTLKARMDRHGIPRTRARARDGPEDR